MDLCYLPRDLLKLMHVIHLMIQKLKRLVLFVAALFLMGMLTYIPYVIIHYAKKEDCTR